MKTNIDGMICKKIFFRKKRYITVKKTAYGNNLTLNTVEAPLSIKMYGKSVQDGVPTPDNPQPIVNVGEKLVDGVVTDVGIGNDICGKNLLKVTAENRIVNGVTFTVNEDGSVTVSGTATGTAFLDVGYVKLKANETYYLRCGDTNINYIGIKFAKGNILYDCIGSAYTPIEDIDEKISLRVGAGAVVNATVYPMLNLGSEPLSWEPYTGESHTLNRTLRAIPVTDASIANYTDADGQMWCADTIEEVNGKMCLVERIKKVVFDGSDDEIIAMTVTNTSDKYRVQLRGLKNTAIACDNAKMADAYCSHYGVVPANSSGTYGCIEGFSIDNTPYGYIYDENFNTNNVSLYKTWLAENPITVTYILATPIITELTAEEVSAIESLHSYDGVTTVMSDAEMEVEYIESASGDPYVLYKKMYIDGKLVYSAGNTVTYVVDSGVQYTEDVDFDASCLSPKTFTPTKSGWKFAGWREDTEANGSILNSKIMGDEPITLYAVFTADITVTYYNNSSSASSKKGTRYFNNGNVVNPSFKLSQASVSGWSARGWSGSAKGNADILYNNNTDFTRGSDATLYGSYQKNVTLSYNGNGSTSGSTASHDGIAYRNYKGDVVGASFTLKSNGFTRGGYNFTEWNLGAVGASISIDANTTAYAQWTLALPHTLLSAYDATPSDPHGRFSVSAPTAISGSMGTGYRAWKNQNADGDGDYNFSCSFKFTIYNHTSQAVVAVVSVSEDEYESTWASGGGNYTIAANSSVTVTVSGGGSGNTNPDEYCRVSARCDSIVIKSA